MRGYRISKEAVKDLEAIWIYTFENWSTEQADRYINLILDEVEFLVNHPTEGRDFGHVRPGYFCSKVKSHFIFYKVSKRRKELEIIRVLHQQMDIESRLSE